MAKENETEGIYELSFISKVWLFPLPNVDSSVFERVHGHTEERILPQATYLTPFRDRWGIT